MSRHLACWLFMSRPTNDDDELAADFMTRALCQSPNLRCHRTINIKVTTVLVSISHIMTTYIYDRLDHSKTQTRLVTIPTLEGLDDSAPLHISLHTVTIPRRYLKTSLESALKEIELKSEESSINKPDFLALSYVWGSPDDPSEVFVDSAPGGADKISITRNLDVALRHIRRQATELVVFWIDGICINQGSLEERSYQVAFMDTIYSVCRKAVVWLGPEEGASQQALELLCSLGAKVKYTDRGFVEHDPEAPPRKPGGPNLESPFEPLPYGEDEFEAVVAFLDRPWFTRGWVRQEISLAPAAEVLCGSTKTDWRTLHNGAACFCKKMLGPSASQDLHNRLAAIAPVVLNICDVNLFISRYETLRDDYGGVRFTDPRDAIYGVKSLLCEEDQELEVRPDYTLSTADVFKDVCVRIVERRGRTHFLSSCELTSISMPDLPSWVPDWSRPMATLASISIVVSWSACAFISAQATYLGDGVLCVSGVRIDEVDWVRDLWDPAIDGTSPVDTLDHIWNCYPGDDYIDSPYRNKTQSMTDAYCHVLAINYLRTGAPVSVGDNRQPFTEAKEALKRIWALKEDYTGFDDLMQDPWVKTYLMKCNVAGKGRCFFTTKEGYIGLAPFGTQAGDIVTVILGCDHPVVLRKAPVSNTAADGTRWKVVGICYAEGLMSGEAIYGDFPSHYRAAYEVEVPNDEFICSDKFAILDTRTGEVKTDPAAVLEEFGMKPSVWSRKPHRLEVSGSVLRGAGVALQDFVLV